MAEPVRSVMLAGNGFLRWPAGEQQIRYRVTVGFDSVISSIHVGPRPGILSRPSRHGHIFLYMSQGRRVALNVAANGHLSPDGPMERSLDGQDWWIDTTPWVPFETPDGVTLALKAGSIQVFESHSSIEEAEAAYRAWQHVEFAEVRTSSSKPTRLK